MDRVIQSHRPSGESDRLAARWWHRLSISRRHYHRRRRLSCRSERSGGAPGKVPRTHGLGTFHDSLSGSGEQLALRDANDNPADTVHYYDDGRWPEAADSGGSSLELRDPRADNSVGENWAASNETSRSAWQTYTYDGVAAASSVGPDAQWKEFVLGLLDKGEVLLDDISVIEAPATAPVQMLQNGTFTALPTRWRIIGNHSGTVIDDPNQPGNKVLRLVSTGSTEHMSNHAETTFASSRECGERADLSHFLPRQMDQGCRQLNTRLYFNRLANTTVLDGHALYGTPGTPNTAFTANVGPTYSGLRHEPAVPAALAPVTVSVSATDPDNVTAMTLWSRPDGGAWTSQSDDRQWSPLQRHPSWPDCGHDRAVLRRRHRLAEREVHLAGGRPEFPRPLQSE